jgi:DNA invertase Pin-like site-specific DNA recombinase
MTVYGYARVSTTGQDLEGQLAELKAQGATKIFQEKISGRHRDRPQLEQALRALRDGDVLIITRLDRLARSSRDLLNIVAEVTKVGASFRSLKEAWADTTTAHGRLILTVLAGLAEFERELIVEPPKAAIEPSQKALLSAAPASSPRINVWKLWRGAMRVRALPRSRDRTMSLTR